MAGEMNHFDKNGNAVMVDVSEKEPTFRMAVAEGKIHKSRYENYVVLYEELKQQRRY